MPIFFQQDINQHTKLAIWKIEEEEQFFLSHVPLQRSITHAQKRLQHLAGRYLLKYLFPDFPIELIQIADTRKPFLEDEAYHFSISHCSSYAAVIVSKENRVGVDIEIPNGKALRILHKFLHDDEKHLVQNNGRQDLSSTILWSAKEAMYKWWGLGEIDFSEMLRVKGPLEFTEVFLQGNFIKGSLDIKYPVNYKVFHDIVLAWVDTAPILKNK
jgi:phosphopantetheinyl transferase